MPLADGRSLVRLWAHEATRVFHDRLVDEPDRAWFSGRVAALLLQHLGMAFADAFDDPAAGSALGSAVVADAAGGAAGGAAAAAALREVAFADFLAPGGGASEPRYQEAASTGQLLKAVEDALADYNEQVRRRSGVTVCRYMDVCLWQARPAADAGAPCMPLRLDCATSCHACTRCTRCTQVKVRLDLVVFRYAAEHVARISRIIKQPYGNALLVR